MEKLVGEMNLQLRTAYENWLANQIKSSKGERRHILQKGLSYSLVKFIIQVFWPTVGSFDGWYAEYEIVDLKMVSDTLIWQDRLLASKSASKWTIRELTVMTPINSQMIGSARMIYLSTIGRYFAFHCKASRSSLAVVSNSSCTH